MAEFTLGRHSYGVPRLVRKAATEQLGVSTAHGCYVATADERIVGAIIFEVDATRAFIHALGVQKPWRCQGAATELKHRAIDYFGKSGVSYYFSYVHQSNSKMKRLNEGRLRLDGEWDESGKYLLYGANIVVGDYDGSEPGPLPWSSAVQSP